MRSSALKQFNLPSCVSIQVKGCVIHWSSGEAVIRCQQIVLKRGSQWRIYEIQSPLTSFLRDAAEVSRNAAKVSRTKVEKIVGALYGENSCRFRRNFRLVMLCVSRDCWSLELSVSRGEWNTHRAMCPGKLSMSRAGWISSSHVTQLLLSVYCDGWSSPRKTKAEALMSCDSWISSSHVTAGAPCIK